MFSIQTYFNPFPPSKAPSQKSKSADAVAKISNQSLISIQSSSDESSSNSKSRKKKKSEESDNDARQKTVTDLPKHVDTYSVVKMTAPAQTKPTSNSEVVEVPVEKVATPSRKPVVVSIKKASTTETPTQTILSDKQPVQVSATQVPTATTLLSSSAAVEQSTESAEQSKTSESDTSKSFDTEIELQLETPKRFNGPAPRLQSKNSQSNSGILTPVFSPIVGVKTPNGKNVVDLTDDDDDTLSELRLNGVSNKSSRKSSRAPSPITAAIKKSIVSKFFSFSFSFAPYIFRGCFFCDRSRFKLHV